MKRLQYVLWILMTLMAGCSNKYYCVRRGGPMSFCTDPDGLTATRLNTSTLRLAPWVDSFVLVDGPLGRKKLKPWRIKDRSTLREKLELSTK